MVQKLEVGQKEIETQKRLVNLFKEKLDYTYLGNYEYRENNSNVEIELLGNKEFYQLLRYGAKIKEVGKNTQDVHLINWKEPLKNDFYIAEEVTIEGQYNKRPDIVLYVNGIALGVIELKRSKISVTEGIRQNLDNQEPHFIQHFFTTQQIIMAGNDSEGLRYGTIKTPEKYYLKWKEPSKVKNLLDRDIISLCNKEKLLEIIHDYIVFDKGTKKLCRHNQYFGVKATQEYLAKREGGIIWHTQGSGKSLTMVWLAKWIRENIEDSRVLLITDREELDEQIEKVFTGVEETIYRTKSGKDLIEKLNETNPWLICSLVHKFKGKDNSNDVEDYIKELRSSMPTNFKAKGDVYVFVDECHRTQSGKLHSAMKEILPNSIFIGFTGTPLLKKDKATSLEVFGKYIHTYKFDEAVKDKVILDLRYEAKEIDQELTSKEAIDKWFEIHTRGLTDVAKTQLKKRWGKMQAVLSSEPRLKRIINDIVLDFEIKPRLMDGSGNAILVAGSIYEACKYYELFQKTPLKKCAIITSFDGENISSIKGETIGEDKDTDNIYKYKVYQDMLKHYNKIYPEIKTKGFETVIKNKFINEPGQMKLLIVVSKLLTGFDAPSATYLYIDKSMKDHDLFQAICRVNRLDGESKDYGYIIDYKDLFKSLEKSLNDYTSEAFDGFNKEDVSGLLKDRLKDGKEKLDIKLETIKALCEGVKSPKGEDEFREYFCEYENNEERFKLKEQRRVQLYKSTSSLVRAYSTIANELIKAGYTEKQANQINKDVKFYTNIREIVKLASGDKVDFKKFEPGMRHLIDSYIDAKISQKISVFEDITLLQMIVNKGIDKTVENLNKSIGKKETAIAETIENNLRRLITDEQSVNPKYYGNLSKLLDELVKERRDKSIAYADYLKKIEKLIKNAKDSSTSNNYPPTISRKGMRALYDNLDRNEDLTIDIDTEIIMARKDGWRNHTIKKRRVENAIKKYIKDKEKAERILELVVKQSDY